MVGLRLGPLSAEMIARLITNYLPDLPTLRIDNNPILPQGMTAIAEMLKTNDDIREVLLHLPHPNLTLISPLTRTLTLTRRCSTRPTTTSARCLATTLIAPNLS
jgi:hypothetical protein